MKIFISAFLLLAIVSMLSGIPLQFFSYKEFSGELASASVFSFSVHSAAINLTVSAVLALVIMLIWNWRIKKPQHLHSD